MVRYLLVLALLSFEAVACGEQQPGFYAFAKTSDVDFQSSENPDMKIIELLSPIQKEDMYLSSVTLDVENEFIIDLDFQEAYEYQEDYYRSHIILHEKYLDKATITLSYNTTEKDRSTLTFCGNWKIYSLIELLEKQSISEAPRYPLFPPPPRPYREIAVREFIQSLFAGTD